MIVYGHRGARFEAPENTMEGFAHAAQIGLSAVEFDVRMSRDAHLVVIHDVTVDRTTDGQGAVADLDLAELTALDARAGCPDWPERVAVPELAAVLEATSAFAALEIELKRDGAGRDELLLDLLLATVDDSVAHRAVFTSFHPDLLVRLHQRRPDLALGLIGRFDHPGWRALARLLAVRRVGVQQPYASRELVADLRADQLSVLGWPCNDAADLAAITERGVVEAVTSDAPSVLLELLRDR